MNLILTHWNNLYPYPILKNLYNLIVIVLQSTKIVIPTRLRTELLHKRKHFHVLLLKLTYSSYKSVSNDVKK